MHSRTRDHAAPLPATYYLPQSRNANFVGRQRVLDSLHKTLSASPSGRIQVVCGAGGVGKTQLALEYAYRNLDKYRLIWWLPSSEPNTLASYFLSLAEQMGAVAPGHNDVRDARLAVCDALRRRSDWLLIFDDAPGAQAIQPYIPEAGGQVLVTTRNERWDPAAGKSFCLRVLERPDAIEFLLRRSGRPFEPSAFTVCQALGDLPLALEQAAAVVAAGGITFADYLRRFEDHWAELLQSGRSAGEYPDSVAMTWELACRELDAADSEVSALFKILGYLAPAEITRSMLLRAAETLPAPLSTRFANPGGIDAAVELLQQFSLISADERAIAVHRVIASLTRDRLPDEQRNNWCRVALGMMAGAFYFDSESTPSWEQCAEALPHALAVSQHARGASVDPAVNAKLMNNVGEYLQQIGQYQQAREAFEQALILTDEAHGPDSVRRSAVMNNLGRVFKRLGDVSHARRHFEAALKLDQAQYGESHHHVAEIANNYGTLLHQSGDFRTALHQFEWALEICLNSYGPSHSKVASITNNLAYALANTGDVDRAIDHFTQALSTAEAAVGPLHPLCATIRTNLGIALRLKGETDAARAEFERAASIGQSTLGPDHTDVARSLAQLGAVHFERGDNRLARHYFQQALDIDERALGKNHLLICARLNDMGRCLKALGDVDASAVCYERSAEILRANNASSERAVTQST
jgi:tetratricopeptide (TPR) repeat protein